MAKKFNDTIRYIDDLLTVNNSKFEKEICNIYPPELTLKRTIIIVNLREMCPIWTYQLVYVVVNM